MKLVVTLILVIVVSSIKTQMKTEIKGMWELMPEKLTATERKNSFNGFTFWMKFTEQEVIFSNSNNKEISRHAGRWNYHIGKYRIKTDTLSITFYEQGSISTNTGRGSITPYKELVDVNPISKFIIIEIEKDKLELKVIDGFPFSENASEKMAFKRVNENYFWWEKVK